ncbi:hypothetical protein [Pedobacter sp. SYP-B3415]|uniref:hypothetical protein n=1 Tax=Pedobacter sp. SYP-B3415 TaxID=2496641 RepID=UPI00101C1CEF|nr:hypothetical protein [Pedobacter sp. SYP-B3415]
MADKYHKMIDTALAVASLKPMSVYDAEYAAGKLDSAGLRQYIERRRALGISDNAALIESYVTHLRISDFNKYDQVLFILEAGPLTDSKAYQLANTNRAITKSIFEKEPLARRVAINNAIINNTMSSAIRHRNLGRAHSAANFTRITWSSDMRKGSQQQALKMLQYYSGVNDTASYLRHATYYYDDYYMKVGADSVKKAAREREQRSNYKTKPDTVYKIVEGKKVMQLQWMVSKAMPRPDDPGVFAAELNNAAYRFFETGTRNVNHLSKAMIWSKRAIELSPVENETFYDTLAALLYRLGFYAEAESTQNLAVSIAGKKNSPASKQLSKRLQEIRKRTL